MVRIAGQSSEHRLRAIINRPIRLNQLYGSLKFLSRNMGEQAGRFLGRKVIDPVLGYMAPAVDPASAKIAIAVINKNGPVLRFHFDFWTLEEKYPNSNAYYVFGLTLIWLACMMRANLKLIFFLDPIHSLNAFNEFFFSILFHGVFNDWCHCRRHHRFGIRI